jgi:hypothetical protein
MPPPSRVEDGQGSGRAATVTRHPDDFQAEATTLPGQQLSPSWQRYDRAVRLPPITVTCDCGASAPVVYGDRWLCPDCGRTWDTAQIPREDYDRLIQSVRRYRRLTLGPPLALCAVLIPLAVLAGLQFAFLLFVLLLAHALLVMPRVRSRATASVRRNAATWKLRPE